MAPDNKSAAVGATSVNTRQNGVANRMSVSTRPNTDADRVMSVNACHNTHADRVISVYICHSTVADRVMSVNTRENTVSDRVMSMNILVRILLLIG